MNFPFLFLPTKRVAYWVFGLVFLTRIWVLLQLNKSSYLIEGQGDMKFYSEWAQRILAGQWTDHNAFYGLPGYAFLLAGIYKIFGISTLWISLFQAFIEGFLAFVIYNIANLIFQNVENCRYSPKIGIFAALAYGIFLPAQAFSIILMPTSLMVAFYWWVVWWCLRERKLIKYLEALATGLGIGLMAMMVATIFFVIPLVVVALYLKSDRKYIAIAGLFFGVLAGCSPAMLHNRFIAHDPVALSAHGGLNFYIGNSESANGYLQIPAGLRANQAQMLADSITVAEKGMGYPPGANAPRSKVSAWWSAQAMSFIREHPMVWVRLIGQKIVNFWNAYQYDDLSVVTPFANAGITTPGLRFGLVSAFGLAGIFCAFTNKYRKVKWVVAGVMLHLSSLLTVFITERYRLAAVPGLLILGAYFVVEIWENCASQSWKNVAAKSVTLVAATTFVTLPVPNSDAWGLDAYHEGIRALATNDQRLADEKLKLAWRYAPENENTNLAVGNLYLAKKDYQWAKYFYRRTLELDQRNTSAMNNLGFIAQEQKMPAVAVIFYRKALKIDPGNLLANYQLASSYLLNQQTKEAFDTVENALRLHPGSDPLLALRLKILSQLPAR